MGLNNSVIAAATVSVAMLACMIPVAVPALGADTQQTPSVGEAKGCKDLREAMMALVRSRRELTEATERVQGDENKEAIQAILNKTGESMKQTNSIMDKLQCAKGASAGSQK